MCGAAGGGPEESELFLRLAWTRHGVGAGRGDDGIRVLRGAAAVLDEVSA